MHPVLPFTAEQAARLHTFLSAPARPPGTLTYPALAGFLFSLGNGPELIRPSEWIPLVFDERDAGYATLAEAEQMLQAMTALHNDGLRLREPGPDPLPPGCTIRPEPLANFAEEAPVRHWARGFMAGYGYLETYWDQWTPEDLEDELGSALMVLSFFSSPDLAEAYRRESRRKQTLAQLAETVVSLFPDAMRGYALIGRAICQARLEQGEVDTALAAPPAVGRNEPCSCGSGKKFKRCCGQADA